MGSGEESGGLGAVPVGHKEALSGEHVGVAAGGDL